MHIVLSALFFSVQHALPWLLLFLPIGGWGAVGGALLGNQLSKKGAKQSANAQQQASQQAFQQAVQYQQQQEAALRKAIAAMTMQTNPFQQAAQGMTPFFGAPGSDVSMFGGPNMAGGPTTSQSGKPEFAPPMGAYQAPAPPPSAPPPTPGGQNFGPTGGWQRWGLR